MTVIFRAAALVIAAACGFALPISARAGPETLAVFDFQFSNLSPVPADEAEQARLKRVSEVFRRLLAESGRYAIVPTSPVKDEVAKSADLRRCNGCADDFARKLGADAAVTGEVQKVSNLIINMNVYVKPLSGHAPERAYSVDLRGNTDESFDRGIRYLVKNEFLEKEPHPAK